MVDEGNKVSDNSSNSQQKVSVNSSNNKFDKKYYTPPEKSSSSGGNLLNIILVITCIALLIFWSMTLSKNNKLKKENAQITNYYNDALSTINEVQDSLNALTSRELLIKRIATDKPSGEVLTTSEKTEMVKAITDINEYLAKSKKKLDDLERDLKSKNMNIENLEKMIAKLNETIKEKDAYINSLKDEIEHLNLKVSNLETEISSQKEKIEKQSKDIAKKEEEIEKTQELMNTIYYVIGDEKNLLNKKIIEKTGGFLGAGKTTQVSAELSEEDFTPMNLLKENIITIEKNIKKVEVLSKQNKSSYKLSSDPEDANKTILEITNKEEFRKVKYLVILLKK